MDALCAQRLFLADRSKAFQVYSVNCEKLGHDASVGQFVVFAPEPLELRTPVQCSLKES